jgi:Rod binding domain-containing protein
MDPVGTPPPPAAAPAVDRNSAAYKAAQEFEAVFLAQMVAQMHSGIEAKGPFGGGFAEETYRALLYQEIGRQMALSGGVGIAAAVYDEMVKSQGGSE